jgi:hypothetical protein
MKTMKCSKTCKEESRFCKGCEKYNLECEGCCIHKKCRTPFKYKTEPLHVECFRCYPEKGEGKAFEIDLTKGSKS